ncbi:MAG: PatB family C-S lyase [Pseudomonadota bacterium]
MSKTTPIVEDDYGFDQIIDRRDTNALVQEGYEDYLFDGKALDLSCDPSDLIHLWIADMALPAPRSAVDAMSDRLQHPIFGYTGHFDDAYYDVLHAWSQRHYGWSFPREHLLLSSGVVPALYKLVKLFCQPGDKVVTLSPTYGYFQHATVAGRATLLTSGLQKTDGVYAIDFADLRQKAADPATKLMLLCHPHNPTGRLWSDDELRQIAEVCFDNGVVIVSDEIHCDLLRQGRTHTPLATLFPDADSIITCSGPSKTFNLAGLQIANVIIKDPGIRDRWIRNSLPVVNPISLAGARGAYEGGAVWLTALRRHLDKNFEVLDALLHEHLPQAACSTPEATYLSWIDLAAYFPYPRNLTRFLAERAGVLVEGAEMFVADGGQHIRMNIACPTATVETAVARIAAAIDSR